MNQTTSQKIAAVVAEASIVVAFAVATVYSAIIVKEDGAPPTLLSLERPPSPSTAHTPIARPEPAPSVARPKPPVVIAQRFTIDPGFDATRVYEYQADRLARQFDERVARLAAVPNEPVIDEPAEPIFAPPAPVIVAETEARWFDGRMVVPVRTIRMRVTAYSPDAQSCGDYADGMTATLHSVWTNGMNLAAADPTVLPYGSMISVPGYDDGRIVPVLDCGGAIKGDRLDVLFADHETALQWGVQYVDVTVWAFADGSPIQNPRELR